MKNKLLFLTLAIISLFSVFTYIYAQSEPLEDGEYSAVFTSDSSMFKVNEAYDSRGILTVKNGEMTLHITLPSKNILNLYPGLAEDAKKEGAQLLDPTVDEVTYSDGFTDQVYGFDIPVPCLNEEFDLALVGKKGKWYDHKVSVSDPVRITADTEEIADGAYLCEVTLEGGSGRAFVESPAEVMASDGNITARIIWSSPHYEYMLIGDTRYEPVQTEGNTAFEIPVEFDSEMEVSACTTAMSQPHLIDYTLFFDSSSLKHSDQ